MGRSGPTVLPVAPIAAQYRYRVRLVPNGSTTTRVADGAAPGPDAGWELVGFRTTNQGDQISVYRLPVGSAA
jgi:hypothetical protein